MVHILWKNTWRKKGKCRRLGRYWRPDLPPGYMATLVKSRLPIACHPWQWQYPDQVTTKGHMWLFSLCNWLNFQLKSSLSFLENKWLIKKSLAINSFAFSSIIKLENYFLYMRTKFSFYKIFFLEEENCYKIGFSKPSNNYDVIIFLNVCVYWYQIA